MPHTFLLVHGAWHGGWCWRDVAKELRRAGHAVFTPTLSGLGDRAHLPWAGIGLATHVRDIVNVIEAEELAAVRLVGHSYGGIVISGVAEYCADRLAHLVYLDALVPRHGLTHVELVPPRPGGSLEQLRKSGGTATHLPAGSMEFLGVHDPEQVQWLNRHLTPHPLKTMTDPSDLPHDRAATLRRTFIRCTERARSTMSSFAKAAASDPSWRYRELATGHDAMVTAPAPLARLLLEVA